MFGGKVRGRSFESRKDEVSGQFRILYTNEICHLYRSSNTLKKKNSIVLVRKRTIPTERPQLAGEVSANFS
jgi:hypothetical protein